MNSLTLVNQFRKQSDRARQRIDGLSLTDPLRTWLGCELDSAEQGVSDDAELDSVNGAIRAVRQIEHLLIEHCVRLRNDTSQETNLAAPESYFSMRAKLPADVLDIAKQKRFSIELNLLFSDDWDNDTFDPVSPTAKIVGYLRSRDRSLQIASELAMDQEGRRLLREHCESDEATEHRMAVLFQTRHHCINAAIMESGVRQVVELASGISPRGLQWARNVPESIYIESDLPALMIHKSKLLRNHILASDEVNHGILHCCGVDALCTDGLDQVLSSIDPDSPFALISEGLLLYFSAEELNAFLDNVAGLLRRHPKSVWITDFVTQANLQELLRSDPGVAGAVRRVFSLTGREVVGKNPFVSDACVRSLLTEKNLSVCSTIALSEQASRGDRQDDAMGLLGSRKIWTVKAAD